MKTVDSPAPAPEQGGDNDLSLALVNRIHCIRQAVIRNLNRIMLPVPIGTLQPDIRIRDERGSLEWGCACVQYPAEDQPAFVSLLLDIEDRDGGTQNMPAS